MATIDACVTIVLSDRDAAGEVRLAEGLRQEPFTHITFTAFADLPSNGRLAVLYPETPSAAPANGDRIAAHLSSRFGTALVAEIGAGDETLRLRLFEQGEPTTEYIAEPGYWSGIEMPPTGGDARRLGAAFGVTDYESIAELASVLRAPRYDEDRGFVSASERHRDIVDLLGLPVSSVGVGYDDILRGVVPDEIASSQQLLHITPDRTQIPSVRQYSIFDAAPSVTDGAIVAHFRPDVIVLEEEYEEVERFRPLGSIYEIRQRFDTIGLSEARSSKNENSRWIARKGSPLTDAGHDSTFRLDVDLTAETADSNTAESILVFVEALTDSRAIPILLRRWLQENSWTAYEYGSMRVYRPEAR